MLKSRKIKKILFSDYYVTINGVQCDEWNPHKFAQRIIILVLILLTVFAYPRRNPNADILCISI